MEIIGITTGLPLKSTVLPVVIPPNFTADFNWHTTGNTRDIFYGVAPNKTISEQMTIVLNGVKRLNHWKKNLVSIWRNHSTPS